MTNPTITTVEPSKSKTWVTAIGGALAVVVPLILSVATYLPEPWPAVVGGVIALLTVVGVYKAPYKPENSSVVMDSDLNQVATPLPPNPGAHQPPSSGEHDNPWTENS